MNTDASPTVTSETTLRELTLLLARRRVQIVDFKLDAFGEYFVKAKAHGRFYCGLSDQLHLCFAQILDEVAVASLGVRSEPVVPAPNAKKQTCRWCGVHDFLVGQHRRRDCAAAPGSYCEPRGRGHRGPDKKPRGMKEKEACE